jgi:hypothetical protein
MASERFSLRLPASCPNCLADGTVQLQTVMKGSSVFLSWCCTGCETEWPIEAGQPRFIERRTGPGDRRLRKRGDRRQ